MCLAIRTLLDVEHLSPETPIRLEASGGRCDSEKVAAALRDNDEHELDAALAHFPSAVSDFEDDYGRPPNRREKAKMMCEYDENQRLVDYYRRYGFKEEPTDGGPYLSFTPMRSTLGDAHAACTHRVDPNATESEGESESESESESEGASPDYDAALRNTRFVDFLQRMRGSSRTGENCNFQRMFSVTAAVARMYRDGKRVENRTGWASSHRRNLDELAGARNYVLIHRSAERAGGAGQMLCVARLARWGPSQEMFPWLARNAPDQTQFASTSPDECILFFDHMEFFDADVRNLIAPGQLGLLQLVAPTRDGFQFKTGRYYDRVTPAYRRTLLVLFAMYEAGRVDV